MHKLNLEIMANYLDKLAPTPKRMFRLGQNWIETGEARSVDTECGTAACACGYAAIDRIFPGLTAAYEDHDTLNGDQPAWALRYSPPGYTGHMSGWAAVRALFQIDEADAMKLFTTMGYECESGDTQEPTPQQVAQHIRDYITHDKSQPFPALIVGA